MGGHGGLNILPQKKWNVYNYDNRDIVEKDIKQHAQKTRKNYETQRKHTIERKFDVLKGQDSVIEQKEQKMKQSYKKDSILNHEFKRLAEENQHVNLFEHEQKIIENKELLSFQKLKQAQWFKDKDIDYSSKFLGTYNDDSKIPWYAKNKGLKGNKKDQKQEKKMRRQRYDMEDLTDRVRLQKLQHKKQMLYGERQKIIKIIKSQKIQSEIMIKSQVQSVVKREFNDERQRSRQKKHDFIKKRQTMDRYKQKQRDSLITQRILHQQNKKTQLNIALQLQNTQKIPNQCSLTIKQTLNSNASNQTQSQSKLIQNEQLQLLRQKRLKRQQKQRKKAEQLRRKLQQTINRT